MEEKYKDLIGKKAVIANHSIVTINNIRKINETLILAYYGEQGIINARILVNPDTGKYYNDEFVETTDDLTNKNKNVTINSEEEK